MLPVQMLLSVYLVFVCLSEDVESVAVGVDDYVSPVVHDDIFGHGHHRSDGR